MNALLTDRYELAMLGAYLREGLAQRRAVFELSLRKLPRHRRFLVVAGIDRIARYLDSLRFEAKEIEYLARAPGLRDVMNDQVIAYLRDFRFRGHVDAMPEGEIAFAGEPILRIESSLAEAQILETFLLGVINHETKVASKAARVVLAAAGRPVAEFGARRIDPLVAPYAARAAYIAGCASTSCEQAGLDFGVPVSGTCAHSYMLAHVDGGEEEAFHRFADAFPSGTALLVDTFDTHRGALRAAAAGPNVRAVRIDSGDLARLGADVRSILDAKGRTDVKIIGSDDMDEYRIVELLAAGAPYDGFGVGTAIVLSPDAPSLGAVYKLVEVEDRRGQRIAVAKRAPGKASYGGAKQVYRRFDASGSMLEDVVSRVNEAPVGEALLVPLVRDGRIVGELPTLADATRRARDRTTANLAKLPATQRELKREEVLEASAWFPVHPSAALKSVVALEG
jgi:nicotinate phosphoribosyltransferase